MSDTNEGGFQVAAFLAAEAAPRTQECRVPALAAFFPEGVEPVWKVRGLTGTEWATVIEAEQRARAKTGLAAVMAGEGEPLARVRAVLGLPEPDAVPTFVQAVEYLVLGSVEPACDHALAAKLAETQPFVFFELVKVIKLLTGAGADVGKSTPSGASQASA